MSRTPPENTPVVKVGLKRANAAELVAGNPALASSPFIAALGTSAPGVLSAAVIRRYPDKVVLMQQGEAGQSLLFVLSGDVRLFARRDADSAELGVAHGGEVLGEGEVLAGEGGRRCSAVAQGQVEVCELPRAALLSEGRVPPALARMLAGVQQQRLKALDEMSDFLNRW